MTYDDCGWHSDTTSELGLDSAAGATHIGMFYAWAVANDLHSPTVPVWGEPEPRPRPELAALRERSKTPGRYLLDHCCGELNVGDLNARGQAFAAAAYRPYLRAYDCVPEVARHETTYHVPDTWETYDAVAALLDEAWAEWQLQGG
ncbi:hypothetical protein FEK33_19305 [Nocardia asteroides NBRC 15531]|uniref:DUF7832 domain-containing protein n=1 Tax=Nocardia asteroides NBRC 15531 TaxID=1110697 RepID=U5E3H2_NOCAS|nr:hypothetical protein [Nocardia asteroides]TLF65460.1 hypothetical protein FEK33_19305 [Nocardia asteroides NBRC 15531]UGT47784.1 hypothetical protein LT345_25330 [Nocardia asteroides]SFM55524.1 hypothetical protein SAMN05444423_103365 [Nocardia asteroides]VEG33293.1 Uncharacterised protein [Nocardia asteroides]GAD82527.1 hypothetical protein NCAST_11_00240 [Nocardia asteroides NBRC 15531]